LTNSRHVQLSTAKGKADEWQVRKRKKKLKIISEVLKTDLKRFYSSSLKASKTRVFNF